MVIPLQIISVGEPVKYDYQFNEKQANIQNSNIIPLVTEERYVDDDISALERGG